MIKILFSFILQINLSRFEYARDDGWLNSVSRVPRLPIIRDIRLRFFDDEWDLFSFTIEIFVDSFWSCNEFVKQRIIFFERRWIFLSVEGAFDSESWIELSIGSSSVTTSTKPNVIESNDMSWLKNEIYNDNRNMS